MTDTLWLSDSKDIDRIKSQLAIRRDDSADDEDFDNYIDIANRQIDNDIVQYKDVIPEQEVAVTADLKGAAIAHVKYQYNLDNGQIEIANAFLKQYNGFITSAIKTLKQKPSENKKTKFASHSATFSTDFLTNPDRSY